MRVTGVIWLRDVVDKLLWKHQVTTDEVEAIFASKPRYRLIEAGDIEGEDLYVAFGQSIADRYLLVFFIHKPTDEALVVSAREMTKRERRSYAKF